MTRHYLKCGLLVLLVAVCVTCPSIAQPLNGLDGLWAGNVQFSGKAVGAVVLQVKGTEVALWGRFDGPQATVHAATMPGAWGYQPLLLKGAAKATETSVSFNAFSFGNSDFTWKVDANPDGTARISASNTRNNNGVSGTISRVTSTAPAAAEASISPAASPFAGKVWFGGVQSTFGGTQGAIVIQVGASGDVNEWRTEGAKAMKDPATVTGAPSYQHVVPKQGSVEFKGTTLAFTVLLSGEEFINWFEMSPDGTAHFHSTGPEGKGIAGELHHS